MMIELGKRSPIAAETNRNNMLLWRHYSKNNEFNFNKNNEIRTDLIRVFEHIIDLGYDGVASQNLISIMLHEISNLRQRDNFGGHT